MEDGDSSGSLVSSFDRAFDSFEAIVCSELATPFSEFVSLCESPISHETRKMVIVSKTIGINIEIKHPLLSIKSLLLIVQYYVLLFDYFAVLSPLFESSFEASTELFSISRIYPAVMIPAGRATIAIPKKEEIIVTARPVVVTG